MMSSEAVKEKFPDTLKGFGYEFKDGKLCDIKTGGPFKFVVREGDQTYNQKHYEALGEVLTMEVYKLLEDECNLKRVPVPYDAKPEDNQTFIFVSDDAMTNPKLMVFIHGSGVVRAGQWARRLIINDCLDSGTQIPFIKRAVKEGYGVLVMNTNDKFISEDGKKLNIKGSETPEKHASHVWDHYIQPAAATHIAIIAHSYGGCVVTALYQQKQKEFTPRVFAVAMTDSVHYITQPSLFASLAKVSCNWVTSEQPLDSPVKSRHGDIQCVSAGVTVHEETSWNSFHSIFRFLQDRYQESAATGNGKDAAATGNGKDSAATGNGKDAAGVEGEGASKRPRVSE